MEQAQYEGIWQELNEAMLVKMRALIDLIRPRLPSGITITEPEKQTNSDEFKVSANIEKENLVVIGLDLTLVDGGLYEDEEGLGINLPIIGYGGLVLGGYFPSNYTVEVWTSDVPELLSRISQLPTVDIAETVITSLSNPQLLAEMAKAEC